MPYFITPRHPEQLRTLGASAANDGIGIYEASIRSGLTSSELLEFEAGYFARQAQLQGQGVVCAEPV